MSASCEHQQIATVVGGAGNPIWWECFDCQERFGPVKEIRRAALDDAANIVNQCRDDEQTDLRAARDRIRSAK